MATKNASSKVQRVPQKCVLLTTPRSPFGLSNRKHTLSFSCKASAISPACSTAFRSRPGLKHAFVEQVSGERQTTSTLSTMYTYSANYMLVTLNMNMLAYWEATIAGSNLRILPKICRQDQKFQTDVPKNWRCLPHTLITLNCLTNLLSTTDSGKDPKK